MGDGNTWAYRDFRPRPNVGLHNVLMFAVAQTLSRAYLGL